MNTLYKYELELQVVDYLLKVLDAHQTRGIQAAQSLLSVVTLLQSPLNAEDLEKEQLNTLKAKYESKSKDEKK